MSFDLPGLVGRVHLDLQGTGVRFNARFADSAFQIPLSRGHGAHVGATQLTESLLLFTGRFLRDQLLIFSTAENHFHPNRSSTDKILVLPVNLLLLTVQLPRHFMRKPLFGR